jgi:hypothetical protein
MSTPVGDTIFWTATILIAIAQFMILRSTRRGMRRGPSGSASATEWAYALVPIVMLIMALVATRHRMHPETVKFQAVPPTAGVSA